MSHEFRIVDDEIALLTRCDGQDADHEPIGVYPEHVYRCPVCGTRLRLRMRAELIVVEEPETTGTT